MKALSPRARVEIHEDAWGEIGVKIVMTVVKSSIGRVTHERSLWLTAEEARALGIELYRDGALVPKPKTLGFGR